MIRHSTTVRVERPPRDVYDFLLDTTRYGEWTEMDDVRFDTSQPLSVGSSGTFRLRRGIPGVFTSRITALEPERLIVWENDQPNAYWQATARLTPLENGTATELVYSGEMKLRGWRRLLEPVLSAEVNRGEAKEVDRLKELVEAAPPATHGVT